MEKKPQITKSIEQYIQLVYSHKSELKTVLDFNEKRKLACVKAKLDFDAEHIQKIINLEDPVVFEAIFEFLITQNPNDYVLLTSDQHLFWQIQKEQMKPLDTDMKNLDLKNKISEKSDELLTRIKNRAQAVFGEEQEVSMSMEKIRLSAKRPEVRLKEQKAKK